MRRRAPAPRLREIPSSMPPAFWPSRAVFHLLRPAAAHRRRRQLDRLNRRPVAGRIPRREPHPFPAGRAERNREPVFPERRQIGGRHDLAIGFDAVAPHHLDELERERPFHIGGRRPPPPRPRDFVPTPPPAPRRSPYT